MGLLDFFGTPQAFIIILLLFSFLPPILFLIWTRNTERYGREPWLIVIKVFVWGAVFSVIVAVFVSAALFQIYTSVAPAYVLFGSKQTLEALVLAVVIAPFVEEAAKALGVLGATAYMNRVQDGIVYGAASGLGFSATENLFYGVAFLVEFGPRASIMLVIVRSVSSTLLHASATSATGYGMGKRAVSGGATRVMPYYLLAVGMHASFNLLVSLSELYRGTIGDSAYLLVVAAWIFAIVAFGVARGRIMKGDRARPGQRWAAR